MTSFYKVSLGFSSQFGISPKVPRWFPQYIRFAIYNRLSALYTSVEQWINR